MVLSCVRNLTECELVSKAASSNPAWFLLQFLLHFHPGFPPRWTRVCKLKINFSLPKLFMETVFITATERTTPLVLVDSRMPQRQGASPWDQCPPETWSSLLIRHHRCLCSVPLCCKNSFPGEDVNQRPPLLQTSQGKTKALFDLAKVHTGKPINLF